MVNQRPLAVSMNASFLGSGKDTVVVLAHGYGGDHSVWDKVAPGLAAGHQVLTFDWCFSGAAAAATARDSPTLYESGRYRSYDGFAEDLITMLDELKLESTVFVGHSMSGMIGCIASVKRPDLFRQLVLVGGSPKLQNTEGYEGGFDASGVEQILSSIESNFDQWTTAFASVVVDPIDPQSTHKFENCLKRMRPEIALPLAKTVFTCDHRDVLENVVTDCHIIQTRADVVVPDSVPKYMQSKIKGKCEVYIIDTMGHFPQLTAHQQFIEVMEKILSS